METDSKWKPSIGIGTHFMSVLKHEMKTERRKVFDTLGMGDSPSRIADATLSFRVCWEDVCLVLLTIEGQVPILRFSAHLEMSIHRS